MQYKSLAVALVLTGCLGDSVITHEIKVSLDDPCLLAFPECGGGSYFCVDSSGHVAPGCEVACVAARALMCEPDGPACVQDFGDDPVRVPVLCHTPR